MLSDMNKFEIRSTKSEAISNDQNPNDQNRDTSDVRVLQILSIGNSNLSLFISNFEFRYSDFEAMTFIRIGRTSPGPLPEVGGLVTTNQDWWRQGRRIPLSRH
jgi:hypothetical protein